MLSYARTNISTSLIQSPFIDANLNHSHLHLVLTTYLLAIHFLLSLLNCCSPIDVHTNIPRDYFAHLIYMSTVLTVLMKCTSR